MLYEETTSRIIKAFYKVYNTLGYGFLEKVYENSMMIEFNRAKIASTQQAPINVVYDKEIVGQYFADMIRSSFFQGIIGDKQLADTQATVTVPILSRL